MKTLDAVAAATLIALTATPGAAEVLDLRVGYWELVWTTPGEPTRREFTCLTPEELESMRFFMPTPDGCTVTRGTQTRTRYEATSVCVEDGERMTIRWKMLARDPMRMDVDAAYEAGGKTGSAKAAARWLQQSCAASAIPNS